MNIAGNWAHQPWIEKVRKDHVLFDDNIPKDHNKSQKFRYTVDKCSKPCKSEEQRLTFHLSDTYFVNAQPNPCELCVPGKKCDIHKKEAKEARENKEKEKKEKATKARQSQNNK